MTTNIYQITPMGEIAEVATYVNTPIESLIDFVIAYVLRQPGNLLSEELRENVKNQIKEGKGHYMYFARNESVFSVKK